MPWSFISELTEQLQLENINIQEKNLYHLKELLEANESSQLNFLRFGYSLQLYFATIFKNIVM